MVYISCPCTPCHVREEDKKEEEDCIGELHLVLVALYNTQLVFQLLC